MFFTGAAGWGVHEKQYDTSALTSEEAREEIGNYRHSSGAEKKSAYALRSGNWKLVVANCTNGEPKLSDVAQIFDLSTDPFEKNDLAKTQAGEAQAMALKNMVVDAKVTCTCFQC